MKWSCRICLFALLAGAVAGLLSGCRTHRPTLTLSIAASLQDAMEEAEASYQREHGHVDFRNNFGSSGTLAREIEQGAPVDAIFSAGTKPVDDLQSKGLLIGGTRVNLLGNSLVLIAPKGSQLSGFDGLTDAGIRLVALGDPASVPAGQYGKQTLTAMKLYEKLSSKIVLGKDVRQVLTYVETGNADAGLVYATDAQKSKEVRVVAVAPESTHDPIVYPLALVAGTRNEPAIREFVSYLNGAAAREIFVKHGFRVK
jgi:molybdate transport system substrate-binding protein